MSTHVERKITHVLFDMDGLLLDTEKFYTIVSQEIASRYGKVFDWAVKAKVMGKPALDAATVVVQELGLPQTPEEHLADRERQLELLFPTCEFMPGAVRLVRHLHAHGVPIAIATSSHSRNFELKATRHRDVFALFAAIVKGDDSHLTRGKPAPDIFQLASSRFPGGQPASPRHVLVFEDAPSGIAAAKAAGMWAVMVPHEGMEPELGRQADEVLRTLEDFRPEEWGLPPFEN